MHFTRNAHRTSTRFKPAMYAMSLEERALTAPRFFLDQPMFLGISSLTGGSVAPRVQAPITLADTRAPEISGNGDGAPVGPLTSSAPRFFLDQPSFLGISSTAGDSMVPLAQVQNSTTNASVAAVSSHYAWTNPPPSNSSGSDTSEVNTNYRAANGEVASTGAAAIVISNWLENVDTITATPQGPGVPYHFDTSTAQSGNLANPDAPINWNIENNGTSPPSPYSGSVTIQGQFQLQATAPVDGTGHNYIIDASAFLINFSATVTVPGHSPLVEVVATTNGSNGNVTVNYTNSAGPQTTVLTGFSGSPSQNLPNGLYATNWQVTIPAGEAEGAKEVVSYQETLLDKYVDGTVDTTTTQGQLNFSVTSIS